MHVIAGTVPPYTRGLDHIRGRRTGITAPPMAGAQGRPTRGGRDMGIRGGGGHVRRLRWVAGLAVLAVTSSACASGGGASKEAGEAEDAGGIVNMVMAPDPVWKWLEDQGIKQEMEEEAGI